MFGFALLPPTVQIESPSHRLVVQVAGGSLTYEVKLNGQPILAPSHLGMSFADGSVIGEHAQFNQVERISRRGGWEDHFGPKRQVSDRFNAVTIHCDESGRKFDLAVRVYDDGFAFRYELPSGVYSITQDLTEFAFPSDCPTWGGKFSAATEVQYPETTLDKLPTTPFCLPAVVKTNSGFAAISESDLRNWSGMFLRGTGREKLRVSLASPTEVAGPCQSPWRVVMVSPDAAGLVSSSLIKTLSEPSRLADTSWIKPGIAAWDPWWTGQNRTLPQYTGLGARGDTQAHKRYIDFAAEMGWTYQLIDWFWYDMDSRDPDTAMKPLPHVYVAELIRYANSKGIKLFLWVHSKDVKRAGADRLFTQYAAWGIVGVKIDFMDSDDQATVRWYEETLSAAARHHLMIDFHGAYKPTGLDRTFPNYITQEGVLGLEYNKLSGELFTPKHMITLPFTRGLLGSADITPGAFLNKKESDFKTNAIPTETRGTRCRQLAISVIMSSPFLVMCDAPENYRGKPGIEFYRGLPTTWDELKVLHADFAESLIIARRKGNDWWIVGMNSDKAKEITISLSFLANRSYRMESFSDGASEQEVKLGKSEVRRGDQITIRMSDAGGFAARLIAQ